MFEKHSTKLMSYNNSQPSSTTTVVDNKPAKTPIVEPLVDNNKLHNAQLQSVSNASADIVLGENAASDIKRCFFLFVIVFCFDLLCNNLISKYFNKLYIYFNPRLFL